MAETSNTNHAGGGVGGAGSNSHLNHHHDRARASLRSFQSPARGAASFIPRAYNSASRYSVLGNLNRRNRSVSQHEVDHAAPTEMQQAQQRGSGDIRNTMTSNEVDHSIDLGSDFSKFLFEEQLADIKIHVSRLPQEESKVKSGNQDDLVASSTLNDAIASTQI